MRRATWDELSPQDQKTIQEIVDETGADTQKQFREDDERAYLRLQERGIHPTPFQNVATWQDAGRKLRMRMIGRTYSREMLERVEAITRRHPGEG